MVGALRAEVHGVVGPRLRLRTSFRKNQSSTFVYIFAARLYFTLLYFTLYFTLLYFTLLYFTLHFTLLYFTLLINSQHNLEHKTTQHKLIRYYRTVNLW